MEDWRRQLDRNPDVVGQVLGKLVAVKMRLTPRPGSDAWDLAAEVDYAGVLREADAALIGAMEALMRELDTSSRQEPVEQPCPARSAATVFRTTGLSRGLALGGPFRQKRLGEFSTLDGP